MTARLASAGFEIGPSSKVCRTVLDTFDGRLRAGGLSLELRDANVRELILTQRGAQPAHVATTTVPSFAEDLPEGPFRARLEPVLDVRALLPLLQVTARRSVAVRRDGAGKIRTRVVVQGELTLDRSGPVFSALSGRSGPVPPGVTVEVEDMAGYDSDATQTRELLVALGLTPCPDTLLGLVARGAGVDLRGFDSSPAVPLDDAEPAEDGYRRVLARLADVIDATWDGTVRAVDPEFLHDLRVAVRRTRSILAQARHVLPGPVLALFREEFSWLGGQTGPARDLDVYVIEWDGYVQPLGPTAAPLLEPVLAHISLLRRAEHATLAETLRSDRYRVLMTSWRSWLGDGPDGDRPPKARHPLGSVVRERIVRAQDRVLGNGRRIGPSSPATDLHDLRKDAKRLRYLIECFSGLLPAGPRKAFVQDLKALQDNLGEHQDTDVHAAWLRSMAQDIHRRPETTADTLLAMGQLAEHFEQRRQAARDEFAQRFAAYDTKQNRRAFRELVGAGRGR